MSIERVKEYFASMGMEERVLEFEESSATVELAAKALHTEPGRIAKTLSFMVDSVPTLIVTAGDRKVDNHKFKERFHVKARMLTPEEVSVLIGHEVGGVCPFAVNPGVTVYLDESLQKYETVFPACGSGCSAIELTVPELIRYSGSEGFVDVTREKTG